MPLRTSGRRPLSFKNLRCEALLRVYLTQCPFARPQSTRFCPSHTKEHANVLARYKRASRTLDVLRPRVEAILRNLEWYMRDLEAVSQAINTVNCYMTVANEEFVGREECAVRFFAQCSDAGHEKAMDYAKTEARKYLLLIHRLQARRRELVSSRDELGSSRRRKGAREAPEEEPIVFCNAISFWGSDEAYESDGDDCFELDGDDERYWADSEGEDADDGSDSGQDHEEVYDEAKEPSWFCGDLWEAYASEDLGQSAGGAGGTWRGPFMSLVFMALLWFGEDNHKSVPDIMEDTFTALTAIPLETLEKWRTVTLVMDEDESWDVARMIHTACHLGPSWVRRVSEWVVDDHNAGHVLPEDASATATATTRGQDLTLRAAPEWATGIERDLFASLSEHANRRG